MSAYQNKELLKREEVMEILSMDRATFVEFLKSQPTFPKPLTVGKNKRGNPILRYSKVQVIAFLELLRG